MFSMSGMCRLAVAAVFLATATPSNLSAGIDLDAPPSPTNSTFELIVMEAPNCDYCALFRRDVLPAYTTSEKTRDIPVRFVDVNDLETADLSMDGPINIVPTFVLTAKKREIGRIPGYMGPENFFHAINYLISSAP
jgi:thioredoxin-related protein